MLWNRTMSCGLPFLFYLINLWNGDVTVGSGATNVDLEMEVVGQQIGQMSSLGHRNSTIIIPSL